MRFSDVTWWKLNRDVILPFFVLLGFLKRCVAFRFFHVGLSVRHIIFFLNIECVYALHRLYICVWIDKQT